MTERPILFSEPLVRAILAGKKTQTRRPAKFKPREEGLNLGFSGLQAGAYNTAAPHTSGWVLRSRGAGACWNDRTHPLRCPFGSPGDRLWVRETFGIASRNGHRTVYRADLGTARWPATVETEGAKFRPSIHMPRALSRITLEVTGVRVERLQAISESDAQTEGVPANDEPCDHVRQSCADIGCRGPGYRAEFSSIWDQIYGEGAWDANPWVWVVEFHRVEASS